MSSVFRPGWLVSVASSFVRRVRVVERRDERLHQRHRPVVRARIAPGFERVRVGDVPVREFGRLVLIEAVVDHDADLREPFPELDVRRRREHRVVAEDHEQLDLSGLHRGRQLRERGVLADRLRLD